MLDIRIGKCIKCPKGFYQHIVKQTFCRQCPIGTSTKRTGASSIDECILWRRAN